MISFHHSFSTRIFIDKTTSPEREARRAQAAAALNRAKEDARTPNELREFWWFLRDGQGVSSAKKLEGRAPARPQSGGSPTLQNRGGHA
jgi:hypothetical protein